MEIDKRYDHEYSYGEIRFYLADFIPDKEQCRFLMLKVLEQAVRDYCALYQSELTSDRVTWQIAKDFLFDDKYILTWGQLELTTEEFLDLLDLDISWVREQTIKKFNHRRKL